MTNQKKTYNHTVNIFIFYKNTMSHNLNKPTEKNSVDITGTGEVETVKDSTDSRFGTLPKKEQKLTTKFKSPKVGSYIITHPPERNNV